MVPSLAAYIVPGPVVRQNIMSEGCGGAKLLTSWLPESIERRGQMSLCKSTEDQERPFKSSPPQMTYFLQQDFASYILQCF